MAAKKKKSKKQSSNLQPKPTFFVDRSLGKHFVSQKLKDAGETVKLHDDHFETDTLDQEWLTVVGNKGWVVLTKDDNIRRRPIERQALYEAQVAAFILRSGNLTGEEMAQAFEKALPKIKKFLIKYKKPFIATVTKSGNVNKLD